MLERINKELSFVAKSLTTAGFSVVLQRFGSAAADNDLSKRDLDVAIIVPPMEKPRVIAHLRQLGGSTERSMNWAIDVFNYLGQKFGYNKRAPGTIHFLVMSQQEYEGDSPLAVNVRSAKNPNIKKK